MTILDRYYQDFYNIFIEDFTYLIIKRLAS
jgi:hypothetical protein